MLVIYCFTTLLPRISGISSSISLTLIGSSLILFKGCGLNGSAPLTIRRWELWNSSLPHIAWGIWKERNNRVFRDQKSSTLVVATRIRNSTKKNFLHSCPSRKNDHPLPTLQEEWDTIKQWKIDWNIAIPVHKTKQCRQNGLWHPLTMGWIKINVDGAAKGNSRLAECGGVARNHMGLLVSVVALPLGMHSNHFAEASTSHIGL